jgi:hypothetical protein
VGTNSIARNKVRTRVWNSFWSIIITLSLGVDRRKEIHARIGFPRSKHKQKCVRVRKKIIILVLGEDVSIEEISSLMENHLTRNFMEKQVSEGTLCLLIEKD